jgi:hypothetical protein
MGGIYMNMKGIAPLTRTIIILIIRRWSGFYPELNRRTSRRVLSPPLGGYLLAFSY